jgi:hypothetical protein
MGPSIETPSSRRRNGGSDGQDLPSGCAIGLLYGSETWVLSERMRGMLEGFRNRCSRQMTRQFIRPDPESEGEWITPSVAATLAAAGLLSLLTYVEKRKAKILVFAERRAIYRKCRRSTPIASNVNTAYLVALANLA